MEPHGSLKTTQAIDSVIDCSPQTNGESLLLTKTPLQLIHHKEVVLVPTWNIHSYQRLVLMVLEDTLQQPGENSKQQPNYKPFCLQ